MKRYLALLCIVGSGMLAALLAAGHGRSHATRLHAAPLDVVINEVAWSGTLDDTNDEWIELYNNTAAEVDLTGWTLAALDGTPDILLSGIIPAHGYFLLERTDDNAVVDIPADQIFTGAVEDGGEQLELRDTSNTLVDSANADGGAWPAGSGGSGVPPRASMERVQAGSPDTDANWGSNDGVTRNGHGKNGTPLNGTPKARNSATPQPPPLSADLRVAKRGPLAVLAGDLLTYTLAVSNAGSLPAAGTHLTDALPIGVEFVAHTAPYPFDQPSPGVLVWNLGQVPTGGLPITFTLTGLVSAGQGTSLLNVITATSPTSETHPADNSAAWITLVEAPPLTFSVLLDALLYDGYVSDAEEAVRLLNLGPDPADLSGWKVSDGSSQAILPAGATLPVGAGLWIARNVISFTQSFGFPPDLVPDTWPGFANDGDECQLLDAGGAVVDTLVYKAGDTGAPDWNGPAVWPYRPSNAFGEGGQILYRKRDQATGRPVPDTDTAADWAQDVDDPVDGRRVQYPGWDLDAFFFTARVTETAVLTVAVGPDHLLDTLLAQIGRAQQSIWIEGYTFESAALAQALVGRLAAGVSVTLLLEGAPAGGVQDAQGWVCGQVRDAGGRVYFMVNEPVRNRYLYQHAKFMLLDDRLALIGSENLNPTSLPADDKADGTAGRRGVYLITDAPGVVARVRAILHADVDPAHHLDIATCDDRPDLCAGSPPPAEPNWISYTVAFTAPLTVRGSFAWEVVQSPENSLRTRDGLLGLLARAGPGDTLRVEQFYERLHWGPAGGTPETDPNPRLEAYLDAARRGAGVRLLLDRQFDLDGENAATVDYVNQVARAEGLDLQARLGNPTHLGIHTKLVLVQIGGRGNIHVGSLNGGEASHKLNRELALQVQSDAAHAYLAAVFDSDWAASTPPLCLPLLLRGWALPPPPDHVVISEVYYKVGKEEEWVEIYNPTPFEVDLSGWRLGDAAQPGVYEGMYTFPTGTLLPSRGVLMVAASAADYSWGTPDLEIFDTDPAVPDLLPDPAWGTGEWELANAGDEVLLLLPDGTPVDVVTYGSGNYPGVIPHPGVTFSSHSLARIRAWPDSDDCSLDFFDQPFPKPGEPPP